MMNQKTTRLLLLFLLMASMQAAMAQNKPPYQYMQLFYYGAKTMAGPVGHFSPAMRGQTDITLATPTAYMKLLMTRMTGESSSGAMQDGFASTSADIIDLTKMTPTQRRQFEEKEQKREGQEHREQQEKVVRILGEHTKTLTNQVTQSLNAAAEDGWEVIQMSSFGTDGVVYLLRKAR